MAFPNRVVLGVTGGIAAYKAPDLVRALRRSNVEVRVVLTNAAAPLVGIEALGAVSGNPVYTDTTPAVHDMDHIRLSEWGQVFVIAPATANTIAKIACGIADNLLTTLALSFEGPLVVAPAMNSAMWEKEVTRHNTALLRDRGMRVLPVGVGPLACGREGPGRMLNIHDIAGQVLLALTSPTLRDVRVLIASGPTVEPIDPVRVITNQSSGRMGSALAQAALSLGAEVTVVTGPAPVPPPEGVRRIDVGTASEMSAALGGEFDSADVCIMAAAVSDFRPRARSESKIAREANALLALELEANDDIAASLGRRKKNQFLVGFALETSEDTERATVKMSRKNCDMMVLNTADDALGTGGTRVILLSPGKPAEHLQAMDKLLAAHEIMLRIAERRAGRND